MKKLLRTAAIVLVLLAASSIVCSSMEISDTYSCVSNRKAVTVYEFGPEEIETVCFANIYRKGRQKITITAPEAVRSFSILPEFAEIKGKAKGNTLSFTARSGKKLHIQVNGLPYLELTTGKPEKKSSRNTVTADYHYAPGEHFAGNIELKDGESLRIEEGAVVHGNITGGGDNISISGRGILHGTVKLKDCDNLRVKDILVQDCDILKADGGGRTGGHSAFSIVCDGAADVHHITYDNIRIGSDISPKNLELILTDGNLYGPDEPGQMHDITIRNVKWGNGTLPFIIKGYGDHIIRNVLFEGCTVAGKPILSTEDALFDIEKAEDIRFL